MEDAKKIWKESLNEGHTTTNALQPYVELFGREWIMGGQALQHHNIIDYACNVQQSHASVRDAHSGVPICDCKKLPSERVLSRRARVYEMSEYTSVE